MNRLILGVTLAAFGLCFLPVSGLALAAIEQLDGASAGAGVFVPGVSAADSDITLTPVPFEELSQAAKARLLEDKQPKTVSGVIGIIGTLVSIGSAIINVVRGGEIVYSNGYGAVYPKDADWRYFTWKKQSIYTFRYKQTMAGISVVDCVIAVSFKYDGQYNGSGRYIGNIQVVGDKCTTLMSNTLNVTAELPQSSVENLTPATPLDPLAAIALNLTYANTSLTGSGSRREAYQIRGDGTLIDLATGAEPKYAAVRRVDLN